MQNTRQIIRLSQDDLTLDLLPGIGGRLWNIVFQGQSLLFNNPDLIDRIPDMTALADLPSKSPQFGFPLWGGEKTWIAPDINWVGGAPYPMLDSGPYDVVSSDINHIVMRSAVCPISNLQIERDIRLVSSNSWSINHKLINRGEVSQFAGIWSVIMLDQPAVIGTLSERPEFSTVFGNVADNVELSTKAVICRCATQDEFKIGTHNPTGRVFMRLCAQDDELWMVVQTAAPSTTDEFAHTHNFEVFNSGDYPYCEAEWHAPATHLQPGQTAHFTQKFQLWSGGHPNALLELSTNEQEVLTCMS